MVKVIIVNSFLEILAETFVIERIFAVVKEFAIPLAIRIGVVEPVDLK
jgi:hypothetical protein